MEENKKKSDLPMIMGIVALILVLFIGVKFVFAALDTAMPDLKYMNADYEARHNPAVSQQVEESKNPAPNFCPHCGDGLPETFDWGQFCPYCGKKVE